MAILGLTKLQAVNRVLRSINELPASVLDTGGSSIAAIAETVLDDVSRKMLGQGFEENTIRCKEYTASAGVITLGADVLHVRGAGLSQHRKLVIRGDDLYDGDNGTGTFGSTEKVWLEVILDVPFEDCSPRTKEAIADEAAKIMQQRWRGSPDQNEYLAEDAAKTQTNAIRPQPTQSQRPINNTPITIPQPRNTLGEGQ